MPSAYMHSLLVFCTIVLLELVSNCRYVLIMSVILCNKISSELLFSYFRNACINILSNIFIKIIYISCNIRKYFDHKNSKATILVFVSLFF